MIDVAALGELLIDFVPAEGSRAEEPLLKGMAGGAPGNFVAAAQSYGLQSALIGKVGGDAFGDLLLRTFRELGVETRGIVQDDEVFTTLAFVTLSERGERTFSFARKPGADTCLTVEECDFSLIDEARLFHFGALSLTHEPSRSATKAAIVRAKGGGKLISFDPNLRPALWNCPEDARKQMLWGMEQADIVKISDDEVEFLLGCNEREGADLLLKQYGIKLVFVTLNSRGCYFSNGGVSGYVSAPAVFPVDTTGAGDIFFGAAIGKVLRLDKGVDFLTEQELRQIVSFACGAASLSTQKHGGIASIPSEAEVQTAING